MSDAVTPARATVSAALVVLLLMALAAAPAASGAARISLTSAKSKVLKHWGSPAGSTYAAECARVSKRKAVCYIVRTAGSGAECGRGKAKLTRSGSVKATSWGYDCASIPDKRWPDGVAVPVPADAGALPPPAGGPPPPVVATPGPPAPLPNPNGYARNQLCDTDNEADYRAAGFTCQAGAGESCITTDFGTTCIPMYVLFPLNADGTVGSRR